MHNYKNPIINQFLDYIQNICCYSKHTFRSYAYDLNDYIRFCNNFDQKKEFIEAHHHHIVPLHKMKIGETRITNEKDIATLCANCHRMIHRYGCPTLDEFKKFIDNDYVNFIKNN